MKKPGSWPGSLFKDQFADRLGRTDTGVGAIEEETDNK